MLHRVFLPQLGQTMEEGTIERWHKQEGDAVTKGEILYELTTDKATLEVEAFAEGILRKVLVAEGQTVPVNQLIAVIADADDELPDDLTAPAPSAAAAEAAPSEAAPNVAAAPAALSVAATPASTARSSSPRARKVARELSVPIDVVAGSGPGGRVIERDVAGYVEARSAVPTTPTAVAVAYELGVDVLALAPEVEGRVRKEDVEQAAREGRAVAPAAPAGAGERLALSAMRRTIAQRMAASKQTVPHFYLVGEVMMRKAMALLAERKEAGERVTVTALLVKAAGVALRENPRANCRFDGDAVVLNAACNVGVAVAVEDGLFVPVIRGADSKGLPAISAELRSLAETAREGKLIPEQYEGGCLTISNLGMFGVDAFLPIINPPESCIIGVGAVKDQVVAHEGGIRVEPVMQASLSADHRAVDGAQAAGLFKTFKDLLEAPGGLG